MVDLNDALGLLHPAIAVIFVFPFIGIVSYFAWQTRQRRLQIMAGKSKIPPAVGLNHNRFGKVLAGAVVGLALLGMAHPIFVNIATNQIWSKEPFKVVFIVLIFAATIASLVFLYRAKPRLWRGIFATLTGTGLVVLGSQDGVFRRETVCGTRANWDAGLARNSSGLAETLHRAMRLRRSDLSE